MKRGNFIQKNCEILQEFRNFHPSVKVKINQIYNTHFTGSPLWDLSCRETEMLENSWNVAVRNMFRLPYDTHRNLIEPVSNTTHIRQVLVKRFLTFIARVKQSNKLKLGHILKNIEYDTRSISGKNLRNILLKTSKKDIHDHPMHSM